MADFDLRKLSAPLESLRTDVKAAYERLDSKWEAIRKQLSKLPSPCTVGYTFWEDPQCPPFYDRLEFRKWKGKKRLCITSYGMQNTAYGDEDTCDVVPYEEWAAEQRVEMLEHVPDLFKSAVQQVKEFVEQTQD